MLVVLIHALLLGLLPIGVGDGWRGAVRRPVQLRTIEMPVPPPAATPAPRPAPRPAPGPTPAPDVQKAAPPAAAAARAAGQAEPIGPEPASTPALAEAPPAPDAGGTPVPVYPTRLPPATRLRYDLRRGTLGGSAELAWRPAAERYELTIDSALSSTSIGSASHGGFDAAGIAPERFVDRRRGRDVRAANFRRDSGRITFSGPQVEYPLLPGAQDRLSWMLQLPAIVEADPARFAPGAKIAIFVTGTRGDGDVWVFEVEAVEAVDVPAGRVDAALHLRREPRRPYDTRVDIWLDPARGHLPVRLRLGSPPTSDTTEFVLREQTPL